MLIVAFKWVIAASMEIKLQSRFDFLVSNEKFHGSLERRLEENHVFQPNNDHWTHESPRNFQVRQSDSRGLTGFRWRPRLRYWLRIRSPANSSHQMHWLLAFKDRLSRDYRVKHHQCNAFHVLGCIMQVQSFLRAFVRVTFTEGRCRRVRIGIRLISFGLEWNK